jgi:HK97 gp10 family phage protein
MGIASKLLAKVKAKAEKAVTDLLWINVKAAGRFAEAEIKRSISTPYPPASKPGKPPHRRTGRLKRSIKRFENKEMLIVRIGTDESAPYWRFLEAGTKFMAARPFLNKIAESWQYKLFKAVSKRKGVVGTKP